MISKIKTGFLSLAAGALMLAGCGGDDTTDTGNGNGNGGNGNNGGGGSVTEYLTVDPGTVYQQMDGLGGSLVYYPNWFVASSKKEELYSLIFEELRPSILRIKPGYGYSDGDAEFFGEFVSEARRQLGRDISVLATSWSPAAWCKSNGDVNGDDGTANTLKYTANGDGTYDFDYESFAQWWVDALRQLADNEVYPEYISIQNEPNMDVTYESCLLAPREINSGSEVNLRAGYDKALDAVWDAIEASELPMPKFVGPEGVGIGNADTKSYSEAMALSKLYAIGYHLYRGDNNEQKSKASTYRQGLSLLKNYAEPKGVRLWQTEFSAGESDWINEALLIHNNFVYAGANAYLYWSLLWGTDTADSGLIFVDNPWETDHYEIKPKYYTFKHFCYFIQKGDSRIEVAVPDSAAEYLFASAYLAADGKTVAVVVINNSSTAEAQLEIEIDGFDASRTVWQTTGQEKFTDVTAKNPEAVTFPARSITTIELKK